MPRRPLTICHSDRNKIIRSLTDSGGHVEERPFMPALSGVKGVGQPPTSFILNPTLISTVFRRGSVIWQQQSVLIKVRLADDRRFSNLFVVETSVPRSCPRSCPVVKDSCTKKPYGTTNRHCHRYPHPE